MIRCFRFVWILLLTVLLCLRPQDRALYAYWQSIQQVAVSGGGGGGISVVQATTGTSSGNAVTTATFGAGIAAGSIIVVAGAWQNQVETITSLTDGNGDTATDSGSGIVRDGVTSTSTFVQAFLTPTAGSTVITLTLGGAPQNAKLVIYEVAGYTTPTFDKVSTNTGVAGSISTTTATLTQSAEFALAFAGCSNGCTASNLALSPGTSVFDFNLTLANANDIEAAHEITAATSALTATVASGFSGLVIWVVTFKG